METKTNIIYNEDCIEGMKKLPDNSVDCVITSPPYNTGERNDCMINAKYISYSDSMTEKEYIDWSVTLFKLFELKLKKKGVICYNMSYSSAFPNLHYKTISKIMEKTGFYITDTIVWEKQTATPLNSHPNMLTRICELIFIFVKNKDFNCYKDYDINNKTGQRFFKNYLNKIKTKNNSYKCDIHKATFSEELVRKLLRLYSKEGDIILDPFMGIGTTAFSCKQMNRKFIGYEIEQKYIEISNKRLSQNTLHEVLL